MYDNLDFNEKPYDNLDFNDYYSDKNEFIGTGKDAIVWRINTKNFPFILKYYLQYISFNNDSIVNKYAHKCPLFIKTLASYKVKNIPDFLLPPKNYEITSDEERSLLKRNFENIKNIKTFYIKIEEDAGIEIVDYPYYDEIDDYDVKCMFFDLLFGIYTARMISGSFAHNDIHERNLSVSLKNEVKPVYFTIDDITFTTHSKFQLHLIDNDTIKIPGHEITHDIDIAITIIKRYKCDDFTKNFLHFFKDPDWKESWGKLSITDETDEIKLILIKHQLFKDFKTNKRPKTCINCFAEAMFKTKEINSKLLCGNLCNEKMNI
jgi:hypothetical protein